MTTGETQLLLNGLFASIGKIKSAENQIAVNQYLSDSQANVTRAVNGVLPVLDALRSVNLALYNAINVCSCEETEAHLYNLQMDVIDSKDRLLSAAKRNPPALRLIPPHALPVSPSYASAPPPATA